MHSAYTIAHKVYYTMSNWIYVCKKALGDKAHINDRVADRVALIRAVVIGIYLITNITIVAGVIHHW